MSPMTHHKPKLNVFPTNDLWIVYGAPKVGKSSYVATWQNCAVFDLEAGYSEIEATTVMPSTYQELLKEMHNKKNIDPYDTIIFDTFDVIYNWLESITIDNLNKTFKTNYDYIGMFPSGSGWGVARNAVRKFIMHELFAITRTNKNVVLVMHEKSETVSRGGSEEMTYKIALPGQSANITCSLADVIGRIFSRKIAGKPEPRISFTPGTDSDGSRIKSLAGKELPLDFNVLKSVIESTKPAKKPKKLTEIVGNESEDDEDDW